MARYATGRRARAICDRCGFETRYLNLRAEYKEGHYSGMKVCRSCWDPDDRETPPQVNDYEQLHDPRSDHRELEPSRRLIGELDFGSNPLGPVLWRGLAARLVATTTLDSILRANRLDLYTELTAGAQISGTLRDSVALLSTSLDVTADLFGRVSGGPIMLGADLSVSGDIQGALYGPAAELSCDLAVSGDVEGGIAGSSAQLGAELSVSATAGANLRRSSALLAGDLTVTGSVSGAISGGPNWRAFFDMRDLGNLSQDMFGLVPVTGVSERVGRIYDPVRDVALSVSGGDAARFLMVNDTEMVPTLRMNPFQYITDAQELRWFDLAMDNRDPWWVVMVAHRLTTDEEVGVGVVAKKHQQSPERSLYAQVLTVSGDQVLQIRRMSAGGTAIASAAADDILSGPVALSVGYDGSNITARVNMGTKTVVADANFLPATSAFNEMWVGDHRDQVNAYSMGFMTHYPDTAEEAAAIAQALAVAGITL